MFLVLDPTSKGSLARPREGLALLGDSQKCLEGGEGSPISLIVVFFLYFNFLSVVFLLPVKEKLICAGGKGTPVYLMS